MGRAAGENFPVALRVLPSTIRRHLLAIYGYARFVDQLGDDYTGDRLAALDWVEGEVAEALRAAADGTLDVPGSEPLEPLVARVARTVHDVGADPALLGDLVEANRRDQTTTRYGSFDDLVDYCRYSANPVGRLVLAAFAATTHDAGRIPGLSGNPEVLAQSDAVCTALQVAEHLQDVAEDAAAGRIYLPMEDLARFGVDPTALGGPGPADHALRALVAFEVSRARRLLDAGRPLAAGLAGWSRVAITAFIAGGDAALDAITDAGFDPLPTAPSTRASRLAAHFVRTWRARPAQPASVPARSGVAPRLAGHPT